MKREIQIYKTSKKTGKSGAGKAPGDVVLDCIVIQPAGEIEKIVRWHKRKKKNMSVYSKRWILRAVGATESESDKQITSSNQFILSTCPIMHADMF